MSIVIPKYILTFENGLHISRKSEQLENIKSFFDETKITMHKLRNIFVYISQLELKHPNHIHDKDKDSVNKEIEVVKDKAKLTIMEFDKSYNDFSNRINTLDIESTKIGDQKISRLQYLKATNSEFINAVVRTMDSFKKDIESLSVIAFLNKKIDINSIIARADDSFNHRKDDLLNGFNITISNLRKINERVRERIQQERTANIVLF